MNTVANPVQQSLSLLQQGKIEEAIDTLLNAQKADPYNADILLGLGIANARNKNFNTSLEWMLKAIEAQPNNANAHFHIADVLKNLQKNNEAIEHYKAGISLNPNIFIAHYTLAKLLVEERKHDDAISHFKSAIKLQPDNVDCHVNIAQVYELLNRCDDARHAINTALKLRDGHIGALVILGKVNLREKNYNEAEQVFKRILSDTMLADIADKSLIANTNIDLALALDKQQKYDEAYQATSTGKNIWSQLLDEAPIEKDELQNFMAKNTEWFTEKNISHWIKADNSADERPDPIFFVGFPRSGTTLTEQILNQHPDIVTSDEKPLVRNVIEALPSLLDTETPFPQNLIEASDQEMKKLRASYWENAHANIKELNESSQLVDKNPLDLMAIGFIARVFPNARILVAIRDPRDVCLSCFMQGFQPNIAMINFFTLESTVNFYAQTMNLWLHYRSVLNINWHQYRYEDLVDDFDKTTREIFKFLTLKYPENAAEFHLTAKKRTIQSASYHDVIKPVHSDAKQRWKNYEKYFIPYLDKLAPFTKEFGYSQD